MESELISKKELLELYGISYGALYRWKRKGLIPEDWFIKKSTVTGQETFFPRALVCERIELIIDQKDEKSLDELEKHFSDQSEKKTVLIINTSVGKKRIFLNDIKSVVIKDNQGNLKDITDNIIGGSKW